MGRHPGAASTYFYDQRFGDPQTPYVAVDPGTTFDHWPSEPAHLVCDVVLERDVWGVFRRVRKTWIATAGSYCQVMGRYTDGTLRLQLGLADTRDPERFVSVDGRFPDWVARVSTTRRILPSNSKRNRGGRVRSRMALVALVAISVAWVAVRLATGTTTQVAAESPPTSLVVAAPTVTPSIQPVVSSAPLQPRPTPIRVLVVKVANTNGLGVYIRRTPSMADRVKAYEENTELKIIGDDVEAEGRRWRHVVAPDATSGYVPSDYLEEVGLR